MKKVKKHLEYFMLKISKFINDYWHGMWSQKWDRLDEKELMEISNSDLAKMQKKGDETKIKVYSHVFFVCAICSIISLYFFVCVFGSGNFSWFVLMLLLFSTILFSHCSYHFYEILKYRISTKSAWDDFYDEMIED